MSSNLRSSGSAFLARQVPLWPVEADEPDEPVPLTPLSGAGEGAQAASKRRRRTPSFVCEVPLRVGPAEERVLQARLQAARALYNACLEEARRRWFLVKQSRAYQQARMLPRHTPERTAAFTAARAAHGFTDAALQAYAKACRHASGWIEDQLDAPVCQKLATRAYRAVLRLALGQARRVRFKGKEQLDTVEGKSNETGLAWRTDRVVWRGLTLLACLPRHRASGDLTDPVLAHGLASRVKYVRLVRRRINGTLRFAAQLICEGRPYQKLGHPLGQGTVGLDLGPSTIAVVSQTSARLEHFCAELDPQAAQIRRAQRHLDRQRRANNPDNYLPNGTVKKGCKGRKHWRASKRQRRTETTVADRQRKLATYRKSLHERLAHQIVRQGSTFLLEKVSYRAWQRRYGRSVQRRAPGLFVTILTRLAVSAGGQVITVPTLRTKLSQTWQCGRVTKKPLSLRVHACPGCGLQMQRDLYSAYLIRFVDPKTFLLRTRPSSRGLAGCGVAPAGGVAAGSSHSSTGERRSHTLPPRAAAESCQASEPVVRRRLTSQLQEPGCCNGTSVRAGSRRRWCGPEPAGFIRQGAQYSVVSTSSVTETSLRHAWLPP